MTNALWAIHLLTCFSIISKALIEQKPTVVQFNIGSEMLIEGELGSSVAFISQSSGDFVLHEVPQVGFNLFCSATKYSRQ